MNITEELLSGIESKARAATPGPWDKWVCGFVCTEDGRVARTANTGQGIMDASFISSVSPDVVLTLIEELRIREKMCEWLVAHVKTINTKPICPYFMHFDTTKICPLWTPNGYKIELSGDVQEWKEVAFGDEEECDCVDCGTNTTSCWIYAARKALEEQK